MRCRADRKDGISAAMIEADNVSVSLLFSSYAGYPGGKAGSNG